MIMGFVGTGAITEALVRGFRAAADGPERIVLSPRNAERAARLAAAFDGVEVAASNQAVIDAADLVCLAVRPQIAREVVAGLRFRAGQTVASLLPTFTLAEVAGLVAPATDVCRLLPVPAAAQRQGPIAIFPVQHGAAPVFGSVGTLVELDQENEFQALLASTALMASYFAANDAVARWLVTKGVTRQHARRYVAQLAAGLANRALDESESFEQLVTDHTTPQGLNAQCLRELAAAGVCEDLGRALDLIDRRVRGLADYTATLGTQT